MIRVRYFQLRIIIQTFVLHPHVSEVDHATHHIVEFDFPIDDFLTDDGI